MWSRVKVQIEPAGCRAAEHCAAEGNNTLAAWPAGCACLCACSSSAVAVARSWLRCCLTLSVLCRRLVRASSGLSSTISSVVLGLPSSEDSALL